MKFFLLAMLTVCCMVPLMGQNNSALNDYIVDRLVDSAGREVVTIAVPGKPPDNFRMPAANNSIGGVILSDVPAYDWSFGCSTTAAAMMAGYYDRNGFPDIYTGPSNGGIAPLNNSAWGSVVINGETRKQCPISATRMGMDGRTTRGHVDDYWVVYGSSSPDPYITNGWMQHSSGDCTGDYMKTSQSAYGNSDGSTTFINFTNGIPYTGPGTGNRDGLYGLKLFFESRGYAISSFFNQYIYGYGGNTLGFTFAQYKQQIDAGHPVLIQVTGHTMLGYGYNDTGSIVYLNDTWDYSMHTMTWGGSYSGLQHYGVSIIQLVCTAPSQPSGITGSPAVCQNTTSTYSISPLTGATSYTWSLPPGWSGISSTNSINATSGSTGGTVYVTANNSCGSGTAQNLNVSVIVVPALVAIENVNILSGEENCFSAIQTITVAGSHTTFVIQDGGSATMVAEERITYLPGTRVYSNGYMHGSIAAGACCGAGPLAPFSAAKTNDILNNVQSPQPRQEAFFRIYPNPTSGNFVVETTAEMASSELKVEIFGIRGEKVLKRVLNGTLKHEFSLSDKPAGIYIIQVITGEKSTSAKIIKQ